jgi:integrase
MARPRKDYRVKFHSWRGERERYELIACGRRELLRAGSRAEAKAEGAARYQQLVAEQAAERIAKAAPGPLRPALVPAALSLRAAVVAYFGSATFHRYKPLTVKQRRSSFDLIFLQPASNGRHVLADSLLADWLAAPDGREAVLRVMGACGKAVYAAHHRLVALNQFFDWLLGTHPQAAQARVRFKVGRSATNPCLGLSAPQPERDGQRRGHVPFMHEDVATWLHACKDDAEQHRAVRFLQITGARVSDLWRFNRGMIRQTAAGRVLAYRPAKGDDSLFREGPPPEAVVPMVPELEALIAEVPADRFCFVHSALDRPFKSAASMSMKVQKWRKECGLPEGMSAHGMRKAATHWWLRHHRDLLGGGKGTFALKTIFGWVTDKELERYTKDFDRMIEAEAMLVKLSDRRGRKA